MNKLIYTLLSFFLVSAILLAIPNNARAQEKLLGELSLENAASAAGEQFVNVNGERVISGRSIMSPVEIETFASTSAKILLAKTGFIKIAPASKMNLYFENAAISGDFLQGSITVDALPLTKFNILTADGAITASNVNSENVFVANLVNNRTQLKVLSGEVKFNGILLTAGQSYPADTAVSNAPKENKSGGSNNLIFIALGIAGAVAAVAALTLSGGGNNNSNVSPVR